MALDDLKVNGMEVSIDEECSRILATRAPAAGDLRVIVAIIKTITDLERIGDEGEKIGYIASRLATMERPDEQVSGNQAPGPHRRGDGARCRWMPSRAWMPSGALRVARQDRMVDEEYEAIHRQCITFMMEDPRTIRRALDVMWVVRSLERIGDHAKNICEYVIYMVHGKDVRHTKLEDVERELQKSKPAEDRFLGMLVESLFRIPPRGSTPRRRWCALRLVGLRPVFAAVPGAHSLSAVHLPARRRRRSGRCFLLAALPGERQLLLRRGTAALVLLVALATAAIAVRHLYIQHLPADRVPVLRRVAGLHDAGAEAHGHAAQGAHRLRRVPQGRLDFPRPGDAGLGADLGGWRWGRWGSRRTGGAPPARGRAEPRPCGAWASGEQLPQHLHVHAVQGVDLRDGHRFVDLVDGGVGHARAPPPACPASR